MATVIHQASGSNSQAASVTNYLRLHGNDRSNVTTTEALRVSIWRSNGTLSNLYINILTNDRAASTFRTRKATVNANLVVSITGSTTGKFEDTSNTDTVTAGDNWHASLVTGAGGTVFTFRVIQVLFAATTNTVHRIGCGFIDVTTASSTEFSAFYGHGGVPQTTEANVGMTMRTAGTLRNFVIFVAGNSRTNTSTGRSRVNSANGAQSVSIGSGATGSFEDTTNSDTIVSGDLVNWSITTSTGTELLAINWVVVEFVTTNGNQQYVAGEAAGVSQTAGLTQYIPFSGRYTVSATESDVIAETNLAFTASLLQTNISANTIVLDSTLTLRKNSGVANQTVAITALTTGIFQDTVNTDTIVATDTLNYQIVTPSTVTAITIRSISMLGDSSISRNINTFERKTFRGVLRGVGRGSI